MWSAGAARAGALCALAWVAMAGTPVAGGADHVPQLISEPVKASASAPVPRPAPAPPPPFAWKTDKVADFDVACVLLGAVAFVMTIFYFLNSEDPDINGYSWKVISTSIVTFCGVLVTNAWNGLVTYLWTLLFGTAPAPSEQCFLCGFVFLGWYIMLQLVLAYLSGAVGGPPESVRMMVTQCQCWATLMSMITSNSCMSFWALVQVQVHTRIGGVLPILLVIPVCAMCQILLYWVAEKTRQWVALADDGERDHWEELWDKFVTDLEGSVLNMTLAHLTVQATRTAISGQIPTYSGTVPPGFIARPPEILHLFLMGLVYGAGIIVINICPLTFRGEALKITNTRMKGICGNCVAFCFLWSLNWFLGGVFNFHGVVGGMLLALAVTSLGMALIVLLDVLKDMDCTGPQFDAELVELVAPLAVLIGFAWKQAFTNSVTTLVQQVDVFPPAIETLILTLCLVTVVIPAWRWYILSHIMEAELKRIEERVAQGPPSALKRKADAHGGSMFWTASHSNNGLSDPLLPLKPSPQADLADLCFARMSGANGGTPYEELVLRNRELEMALASIRGLCVASSAGQIPGQLGAPQSVLPPPVPSASSHRFR